jgi:mono/diheme cytochrome c family protein
MRWWFFSAVAVALAIVGCVAAEVRVREVAGVPERATRFDTTYEKLLPLAEAGDPEVQNLLGFMFFHGEAVERNFELAHDLFHKAAEQGNTTAQRNLGIFHAGGVPDVPARFRDAREANRWLSLATAGDPRQTDRVKAVSARYDVLSSLEASLEMARGDLDIGEKVFATFCAGCHGFDGIAAYASSPSFALGEALEKSDEELTRSIRDGKNIVPAWGAMLTQREIRDVVAFVRSLERGFQEAIGRELRGAPKLYFRFRSLSEHEGQWYEEPVR